MKEDYRTFNSVDEKDFVWAEYKEVLNVLIDTIISSHIKEMVDAGKPLEVGKRDNEFFCLV